MIYFLLPFIIFTFLFVPFIDTPTCWDAGAEWGLVNVFYKQGIKEYSIINITHPPFKPFLESISLSLFGSNAISYNLVGLFAGYIGIGGIYLLSKTLFGKNVAIVSSLLLSTFPLFLANGINNLNDYLATSLILLALYFYIRNKLSLYVFVVSFAVFTKETAALLPLCVFLIEIILGIFKKQLFKKNIFIRLMVLLIPLLLLFSWHQFARINGRISSWSWNSQQGAFTMIINNLLTLNIFTNYTKEHITKLLLLNFHWVYWIVFVAGLGSILKKAGLKGIKKTLIYIGEKERIILVMSLFFIVYILTVLTFQVPPTARYYLPLIPFLIIGCAYIISRYIAKIPIHIILLLGLMNFVSLFFSVDPISQYIYGKQFIEGQHLYTKSVGDDALVYNLQYLLILRQRRNEIMSQYEQGKYKKLDWQGDSYIYTKHCNFRS